METPNVPVVPVQSPSPLHDKSMKWNILIGGGLLVVGIFSYFLAGGGIFKGQIKLASNNLEQMTQADIDELGKCIDFKQSQTYEQVKSNLTVQEIKLKKGGCPNDLFVAVAAGQGAVGFMHSSIKSEADKSGMTYAISYKTNGNDGLVTLNYGDGTEVVNISPNTPDVKIDEANKTFTIKHTYSNIGSYKITATQEVVDMKNNEGKQLYLTASQDIEVVAAKVDAAEEDAKAKAAAEAVVEASVSLSNPKVSQVPTLDVGGAQKDISFFDFDLTSSIEAVLPKITLNITTTDAANFSDIVRLVIYDGNDPLGFVSSPFAGDNVITLNGNLTAKVPRNLTVKANFSKVSLGTYEIKLKDIKFNDPTIKLDAASVKSLTDGEYYGSKTGEGEIKGMQAADYKMEAITKNKVVYDVVINTELKTNPAEELIAKYISNIEIGKTEGLFVKFLNDSQPFDKIISQKWDLGDGTSEITPELEHVYKYPALMEPEATYKLALTVSDGTTNDTYSSDVTIKHPVSFKISCIQRPGTLLGTCTLDPFEVNYSDNIQTVDFDFGDGTIITKDIVDNLIPNVGHEYANDGVYNVVVTMTDDFGLADLEKDFNFNVVPAAEAPNPAVPQVSASAYLFADSFSADIAGKGEGMPGETVKYGDGLMIIVDNNQEVVPYALHFVTDMKEWAFDEPRKGNLPIIAAENPVALKAVCSVDPLTGTTTTTEFTFSGKDSTGPITVGRWDFGDESPVVQANSVDELTKGMKHTYATAGNYYATLSIIDANNNMDSCKVLARAQDSEGSKQEVKIEKPAEKPAEKPVEKPVEKPAATSGNTNITNYYTTTNTTTTNTTTTTTTPATPAPAAPTEGISRNVVSPTIFAGNTADAKLCSGLVEKNPIVLDDTLNQTISSLTQLEYKNDRVINGYKLDGKVIFNAAKEISKAEFLKMLFYVSCEGFKSTTTENWYDGIWQAAIKKGLVSSSDDPNAQLTIREAVIILSKVVTVNKAPSTFKQYFVDVAAKDKDYSKFQDMAYNDIYLGRLVNGERRADPSGLVLREVAASILNNYLSK